MNKFAEIVAAVARERGGVVDLEGVKSDVLVGLCLNLIDDVWASFDAGWVPANLAEQILQGTEELLNKELVARTFRLSIADRAEQARHRAEHQAGRGVRKVRGAKSLPSMKGDE